MGLLRPARISKIDKPSTLIVLVLAILSVLMVGSTTIANSGFWTRYTLVQSVAFLLGAIMVLFLVSMDYRIFDGTSRLLYFLSIAFLLTVYVPGLGISQYGARSWISLGFTTVQPSEVVKIFYTLILAEYLAKHHEELFQFKGLVRAGLLAAPIIAIVLKEDLGSALAFMSIWLAMVFFAGLSLKVFAKFLAIVCALIPPAYLFMASYQKQRISAFLHPDNLSLPGNYQVYESKIAIGSGGLLGKGLFHGSQKELSFIPVQQSDFIFSVVAEELGLIGGIILIALFAFLLLRFMKIAIESKDLYGALIVAGFTGMFLFQIFENIAMTIGLMPVTGITLPFISYGGSSILSNMLAFGFIMSVRANSQDLSF